MNPKIYKIHHMNSKYHKNLINTFSNPDMQKNQIRVKNTIETRFSQANGIYLYESG